MSCVRAFVRAWNEHQVESRPESCGKGLYRDLKKICRGDFEINACNSKNSKFEIWFFGSQRSSKCTIYSVWSTIFVIFQQKGVPKCTICSVWDTFLAKIEKIAKKNFAPAAGYGGLDMAAPWRRRRWPIPLFTVRCRLVYNRIFSSQFSLFNVSWF